MAEGRWESADGLLPMEVETEATRVREGDTEMRGQHQRECTEQRRRGRKTRSGAAAVVATNVVSRTVRVIAV